MLLSFQTQGKGGSWSKSLKNPFAFLMRRRTRRNKTGKRKSGKRKISRTKRR